MLESVLIATYSQSKTSLYPHFSQWIEWAPLLFPVNESTLNFLLKVGFYCLFGLASKNPPMIDVLETHWENLSCFYAQLKMFFKIMGGKKKNRWTCESAVAKPQVSKSRLISPFAPPWPVTPKNKFCLGNDYDLKLNAHVTNSWHQRVFIWFDFLFLSGITRRAQWVAAFSERASHLPPAAK